MTITYAQEITLPPATATSPVQQEDAETFPKVVLVRNLYNEIDAILFCPQETVLEQPPAPEQPAVQPFALPEPNTESKEQQSVSRQTAVFTPTFNLGGFKRPLSFWK